MSKVPLSQAFHIKGDLFFTITEKMQDSQLCCSFWSAVRKGRKSFSLLFQGRQHYICKNVSAHWTFQLNLDLFIFYSFFNTDVLVNAFARSSSVWTRHKLRPYDSCPRPCRVIIDSWLELLMEMPAERWLIIVHVTLILLWCTAVTRACLLTCYSMVSALSPAVLNPPFVF